MKRHTLVAGVLNILTVGLALAAWLGTVGSSISALEIASILGVIAFSLMWVHYAADILAPNTTTEKDVQYYVSRYAVLFAILTHPFLVNYYLITSGYGFPPASYEALLGSLAIVVILGYISLGAFLLFELRSKLQRFDRPIFHANILAMFLVLIHGFLIGMVLMESWYFWVWFALLVAFAAIIIKRYKEYYVNNSSRKYIAFAIVAVLAIAGIFAALSNQPQQVASESQQTVGQSLEANPTNAQPETDTANKITLTQLAENNGLEGSACWVAVDGVVYDTSGIKEWQNGEHTTSNGQAKCGEDLTSVIARSPHGKEVLGDLKQVGTLE